MDEAVHVSPWIALPGGRHSLGLGRHWHFFAVAFWVLNGMTYVVFLFGTGGWRRLIGFKMIKWIKSIELVQDYRTVGEDQGGYREDFQYFGTDAEI